MMCILDEPINQVFPFRVPYEMQLLKKTDYLPNAKLAINMYTANSEMIGVKEIKPNDNKVILRNGREIEYNHIVIAAGLKENLSAI